jgi:TorA maturation chaperone TorD
MPHRAGTGARTVALSELMSRRRMKEQERSDQIGTALALLAGGLAGRAG